jgi:inosine/xanthosine triphosphate pyrophosphatase family protein
MLIASRNPHKVARLREIVERFGETATLEEAELSEGGFSEEGSTLLEIAQRKAAFFSDRFGGMAIATDSGAEIPALQAWDPRFTKRFAGEGASDFERMDRLLAMAKHLRGEGRRFYWKECVALADRGRVLFSAEARGDEGMLQTRYDRAKYREGIWLCSLWYYPRFGKNFFDLTPRELALSAETSWVILRSKVRRYLRGRKNRNGS